MINEVTKDLINQRFSRMDPRAIAQSFSPAPAEVQKVGYQCQMLYKTGVHHQLTCLNKASRSTRCNDNNNISLSALTQSGFGQCTLDPFGSRVANVNFHQQIELLQNHPPRDIGWKYKTFKPVRVSSQEETSFYTCVGDLPVILHCTSVILIKIISKLFLNTYEYTVVKLLHTSQLS